MKDPRGVLMFAHNNDEIDYFKIACANALMIHRNLKVPVAIFTDQGTYGWALKSLGLEFINQCFKYIIISDRDYIYQQKNPRIYKDTAHSAKSLPFYNCNHWMAYEKTPFEETLFIDSDYLVMSDTLANCWGSANDVMISHDITNIATMKSMSTPTIDVFGITQYWATVIYFKKSPLTEYLFTLVKHIFDNYEFYRQLYLISGSMFRNDYAFSIAVHMLNGFSSNTLLIPELPIGSMLMSFDTDDVYDITGINNIVLLTANSNEQGKFLLLRCKDTDIHIMNKYAVGRIFDKIVEYYGEENGRI